MRIIPFETNFQPDFEGRIVNENEAITLYQPTSEAGEERRISTNSILGLWKTIRTIFSHIWYLFSFFAPQRLASFTLLDTDQNRSNSVNWFSLMAY